MSFHSLPRASVADLTIIIIIIIETNIHISKQYIIMIMCTLSCYRDCPCRHTIFRSEIVCTIFVKTSQ